MKSTRFITGLFDITEGFDPYMPRVPRGVTLPSASTRFGSLLMSIFAPFWTLNDMVVKLFGAGAKSALLTASAAALFVSWIGCMIGEITSVSFSLI